MAKADMLSRLINTLTKAEKRYFRMYTALQQGNKDYVNLFDLMEHQSFKSTAEVKLAFQQQYAGCSYDVCSKYLYKVLLDCLLHLRLQKQSTAMLTAGILKCDILFERSLHEEALKQLQKIQTTATANEKQLLLLWAQQQEIQLLQQLNFSGITAEELSHKQSDIQHTLDDMQQIRKQTTLYETLRHTLLYRGSARTIRQQESVDMLHAEMPAPVPESTTSLKTHLLFQAHYHLATSDHPAALQVFHQLNQLLETHPALFEDTPADHLLIIEGILDSLRAGKHYEELFSFIDKIKRLKSDGVYFEIMQQRLLFIYESGAYIDSGDFGFALKLLQQYAPTIQKNISLMDISKQAEIYLYMALIYLGNEDINNAHNSLEQVLQSNLYSTLPIYRTCRLVHLLIQYELGNFEYIRYETRAFRRHLQPDARRSYMLERTVIKFLGSGEIPAVTAFRTALWKKMNASFDKIRADKYERQQLKLFDFSAWIEAKLKRKSLGTVLQEKIKN
ncbi:hypothetical protein [Chitinophaga pinensis]|uniref:Uncharacterized protein n=1 Tax=Chitinophaga pinensis (strain ATCC 43595 / DSM 2588 / LMG 13176 / NBRC 15968 / NCIMB 11800 / UQM 2034) TaxID=485918 RepID=A0A979GN68_CHIPD|nr:hypothetical protein [Chitinophaga pinensis]ACU59272.1 hypothetical protein Cpin_1776 [Chitinophaga pinensis DSM 2588]